MAGILINVVGFAGATGRTVPLAATRIYQMSFFTGFGVSALVYWTLNALFPVRGAAECTHFDEVDVSARSPDAMETDSADKKSVRTEEHSVANA